MTRTVGIIFACVACLLVGLAIGFNLQKGDARQTAIKWKYGDAELEIDLEKDMADDQTLLSKIFSESFSAAGAKDWLKKEQELFYFLDRGLVDKFAQLEYDADMSEYLRDLRISREGPWAYQSDTILLSIPSQDYQPARGHCNVCQSKKYWGKTVKLFDLKDSERETDLIASGRYPCPPNVRVPDFQLNRYDAQKLLGFGSLQKYESALALIISD